MSADTIMLPPDALPSLLEIDVACVSSFSHEPYVWLPVVETLLSKLVVPEIVRLLIPLIDASDTKLPATFKLNPAPKIPVVVIVPDAVRVTSEARVRFVL